MKKTIITLGTILFLNSIVQAQYVPKILPPSPNATSIAKFVESPVSYYRGSANVGIPLFNIDTGDIPLSVSIQYDTKGIRVGEIASSVGAGWSLAAGGLITRQVRQRPDENGKGYLAYSYNTDFETNSNLRNTLYDESAGSGSSDTPLDEDPDLFFISFLGKSAKFIIDNVTKKAVVQSFDDWKIDIDYEDSSAGNYRINRIIIIDELGNKYSFGQDLSGANSSYDIITSISTSQIAPTSEPAKYSESGYRTAWHLKEVKTLKNSYIFNYTSEQVVTYSKTDVNKGNNIGASSLSTTSTTQNVLQNITFPEGTLDFIFSASEREDLDGGKALQSIALRDKNRNQIKKIDFVQNYRSGNNNNIDGLILSKDKKSDKRLFLNQINETGRDQNTVLSYKLEYNTIELPNRHSTSIDYWGYYNGKSNAMNILTDIKDGNRDVYGNFTEAGILKKITYPTGGSENFYYEDNAVLVPTYFSMFLLANPSRILYDDKTKGLAKAPSDFVLNNNSTTLGKYIKEFEIPALYGKNLSYTARLGSKCSPVPAPPAGTAPPETADCKTKVRLHRYDKNTGAVLATYIITQANNVMLLNPPFESGNYRLEVSNPTFTLIDSENFETNPFSIVLHWKEYKPNVPITSFMGGGRRISKIETNENGTISKRKFAYTLDNGTTSGKLLGIPDYMCIMKKYGDLPLVAGQLENRIQPMSSFNNAGQVGYSQVTETFSAADDSVLWSKKYNFSNYADGGEYYRFPYHLPDDMDWARGLNLKTTSYDALGKTVETLENKYNFSGEEFSPYRFYRAYDGHVGTNAPYTELTPPSPSQAPPSYILSHEIKSIPMYKFGDYLSGAADGSNDNPNIYRTAFFYGGMIRNYQKIKTEYINGVPTQKTYIDTRKESLSHHQITSEKTTYSDEASDETNYLYASEKGNQRLLNANMVGIPLEKKTVKKQNANDLSGKIIARVETQYNNPANLFASSVVSYGIENNTASTEVTYDKYDSKGNLLQYTTKDGISTVIIWGYNQTKPIAKIENIKLENISQSFIDSIVNASDLDGTAGSNNDETNLLNAFKTFRTNLSGYQVTTYSYDPLVGVRSITPPSGIRETYVYDTANRLEKVIDSNGKILKELKYNYKN